MNIVVKNTTNENVTLRLYMVNMPITLKPNEELTLTASNDEVMKYYEKVKEQIINGNPVEVRVEIQFPLPIVDKTIEDQDLSDLIKHNVIEPSYEQDKSIKLKIIQDMLSWNCSGYATSDTSMDVTLDEDPDNNYFDMILDTDAETGDTTITFGEVVGFEDMTFINSR